MGDFIIILILIVIFACLVWLLYKANELQKKNIYVYPKTKNKYLIKGIVKMKDTLSLEWVDAVLYISLKTGEIFIRERKDFLKQFITLKEWEKQDGNSK